MAVIPQIGYKIDPNNPNAVIRDLSIPLSTLTSNEKPLNIQQSPQVPPPDIKNIPITAPAPKPESANDLTTRLEELNASLLGKETKISSRVAEKTAPYEQSLNELNTQIKLHQANALARQEEALKQGETLRYSTGLAGQVARTDAIEAMKLSALAQGMQGNILLAEKQARNAVEAEFAQTEKDLATARQNIINNYDTFTAAEKKRADAALLSLNEKDAFVARNKAEREQSYKIALEAVKNGLTDNKLLTEIQNSTPEKALELAQPFLKEKVETPKPIIKDYEVGGKMVRDVIDSATGKLISRTDLGIKPSGEDEKKDDYAKAEKFLIDNPAASYEELKNALLQNTKKLSISEIEAVLADKGITKDIKPEQFFTAENIKDISKELIKIYGEDAVKSIETTGKININDKDVKLSKDQIKSLSEEIKKQQEEKVKKPWWKFW
ncbi:MAG: hypothetical protein L6Q29_03655 [Candidatus Pacebacteria bacterium]|nr:hypothetical protein [Candidatus Paceibacterota bacterium]